jgi:hypothetical protein
MNNSNIKALYIVVNEGFAEQIVAFIRSKGATGATIVNARGMSILPKEIMGITAAREKEIILTITDTETADIIMRDLKAHLGSRSPSHGICFSMPVSKTAGLPQFQTAPPEESK